MSSRRRTLTAACLAHGLHDGYVELIYVMLPIWQTQFGLGYAALAAVRAMYHGTLAGLQIPSERITARWLSGRAVLVLGTTLAAFGYALAGLSGGFVGLCIALSVSGAGSSMQHPAASAAIVRAYCGSAARGPLGVYNFAGDVGKALLAAVTASLLTVLPWTWALFVVSALGLVVALGVWRLMPVERALLAQETQRSERGHAHAPQSRGFGILLAMGMLDSAARTGFLVFLPFVLQAKGATLPTVGLALFLVFSGGAAGKFTCGWLGAKYGVLATVIVTEVGTGVGILAVLASPLVPALVLLPLLGVMLNGTSSVLYGSVPDLAPGGRSERGFALFYTGTMGAGAAAPVVFGFLGDLVSLAWAAATTAATAFAILPLAVVLNLVVSARGSRPRPAEPEHS